MSVKWVPGVLVDLKVLTKPCKLIKFKAYSVGAACSVGRYFDRLGAVLVVCCLVSVVEDVNPVRPVGDSFLVHNVSLLRLHF